MRLIQSALNAGGELEYTQCFKDLSYDYPFHFTLEPQDVIILGRFTITEVDKFSNPIKIAWVHGEPRDYIPEVYSYVKQHQDKFDLIFTFDKDLLTCSDKFRYCPMGETRFNLPHERQLFAKSRLVSFIGNVKKWSLPGHHMRDKIHQRFGPRFDLSKHGHGEFIYKLPLVQDFMYSIAVENCQRDYYFSEKILDCIITGTIPIYWGCPSILEKTGFNPDGIIQFNTLDELEIVLDHISEKDYYNRLPAVIENYRKAEMFLSHRHPYWLWKNGLSELFED